MWAGPSGYRALMEARASRLGFTWSGELGERAALHFGGIHLLFGAPGTLDAEDGAYADYFSQQLAADKSTWRICSWHKNQKRDAGGGQG